MGSHSPFARPDTDTSNKPPQLHARFFYQSPLSLDDPLAPVQLPTANPIPTSRIPPKPFSAYDSEALDRAWTELQSRLRQYQKEREQDAAALAIRKVTEWKAEGSPSRSPSQSNRVRDISRQGRSRTASLSSTSASRSQGDDTLKRSGTLRAPIRHSTLGEEFQDSPDTGSDLDSAAEGTTGTPFLRAPVRPKSSLEQASPRLLPADGTKVSGQADREVRVTGVSDQRKEMAIPEDAKVMVGAARIHHVSMPKLDLEPTYWKPVNDISPVSRATWFYKATMLPVEVDAAIMLEAGYINVRAWSQTWVDELNSAIEVGAIGEEKIAVPLWPELPKLASESRPHTSAGSWIFDGADEDSKERKLQEKLAVARDTIDQACQGTSLDGKAAGTNSYGKDGTVHRFAQMAVIYANDKDAYLLKPNLQPSNYYGRRPLTNYIRKGHEIGVHVVRGFDEKVWTARYPPKMPRLHTVAAPSPHLRPSLTHHASSSALLGLQPRTTDLVLVIHGIGQKLSERMESYNFTHAMNAFRREINVELASTGIRTNLRKDAGGIMILPVNWRTTLSFDDGGYRDGPEDATISSFSLKDITPSSLPSVRNIVSDVMLDIPYYLSHHQPKMIAAVIQEANRVFRLWCRNNPGFEQYGRVHLLAHSLGSVMALDILSSQPTSVRNSGVKPPNDHFAFDTTNLYLLGSPAGFFLLLRKANLVPRRDRKKPASDGDEATPGVAGTQGTFGCVAVDNIYNIVNPYDPVAYRVNAAVDAHWSEILKPALIPAVDQGWFAFGKSSRSTYGSSVSGNAGARPTMTHLPSQVELETHNFTREELAEKRAYLLNDNGQIDFFLRYGGGPLEIQYLTMLSAHSSYWVSKDFIRFLVMEIGRRPGKDGALQALRPVKKREYRRTPDA